MMRIKNPELRETNNEKGPENPGRRRFLMKAAGMITAMAATGRLSAALESFAAEKKVERKKGRSLENIINYNAEKPIEITPKDMEELEKYWIDQYQRGELAKTLEEACERIGFWGGNLKMAFINGYKGGGEKRDPDGSGINKEAADLWATLPIVETEGRARANSSAGAKGLYQFMPETGAEYGLKRKNNTDERGDPYKSATAAGKYLRKLFNRYGDRRLALMKYNGRFVYDYQEATKTRNKTAGNNKREKLTYEGFLEYISGELNRLRQEYKNKKDFDDHYMVKYIKQNLNYAPKINAVSRIIGNIDGIIYPTNPRTLSLHQNVEHIKSYTVREGDTLQAIANRHAPLTVDDLMLFNYSKIKDKNKLGVGQSIAIPLIAPDVQSLKTLADSDPDETKRLHKLNPWVIKDYLPLPSSFELVVGD